MILYENLDTNFESCTSIKAKIAKIDGIINALLTTALTSVQKGNKIQYTIDDGQTKQTVIYSKVTDITDAINAYERIRQIYANKLTGNEFRNLDARNLKRGNYGI